MTVWLEFPPNKLNAIKTAYLGKGFGEKIQDKPPVDATGTRMLVGTSRATLEDVRALGLEHAPWLIVHETFPSDWEYPDRGQ